MLFVLGPSLSLPKLDLLYQKTIFLRGPESVLDPLLGSLYFEVTTGTKPPLEVEEDPKCTPVPIYCPGSFTFASVEVLTRH